MTEIRLRADVTHPDTPLAWYQLGGGLKDLTGWTLTAEVLDETGLEVVYSKGTGVSGGDGTGTSNVSIAWTTAELIPLADAETVYLLRVVADQGAERDEFFLDARRTLPRLRILPAPA